MSTSKSPTSTRARKISGGRERCALYLPAEEVKFLDEIVARTDSSRSSVIAQFYYAGKLASQNANQSQN